MLMFLNVVNVQKPKLLSISISMSGLTEEQKARIEENRRKALEKRAERANSLAASAAAVAKPKCPVFSPVKQLASQNPYFNSSANSTVLAKPPSSSVNATFYGKLASSSKPSGNVASGIGANKSDSLYGQNSSAKQSTVNAFQNGKSGFQQNRIWQNKNDKFQKGSTSSGVTFNTSGLQNTITGTCVIVSEDRFWVDVGYHKELIEIFKTVPSKMYDPKEKKWSFDIRHHDDLVKAVKPLSPAVVIGGLPSTVLKSFTNKDTRKESVDLSSLDCKIETALMPFQKDGVCAAIQKNGRILLADDMGLGKTIQAIAIAAYYKDEWPVLTVTPSSVRFSWKEAYLRWLPTLQEEDVTVILNKKDDVSSSKVVITSYDLLSKKGDELAKKKFQIVIMDESHFLKNPKAARTKAGLRLLKTAKRVLLLTGTPALSRPIELYTQISSVNPKLFPNYVDYGIRYCNGKSLPWGWDFSGSSNMQELQLMLEKTVMIRRLKSEVISQLPSKTREMVLLDPSLVETSGKVLQHMSEEWQKSELKGMQRRGLLLTYFRETGLAKIKAVCNYIEELIEGDTKFLCFAHHHRVMDAVSSLLDKNNCNYIRIDGTTPSEMRKTLCDKFQYNETCNVAVLSITAANAGITLSAASLVIFAELFWNPGILTQAEDRVHRIGQQNAVIVRYLVAKKTADDIIWPLVQHKLDVLNKAGLSKDDFSDVDLKVNKNTDQKVLEDFWDSFEDDDSWCEALTEDALDCSYEPPEKNLKT